MKCRRSFHQNTRFNSNTHIHTHKRAESTHNEGEAGKARNGWACSVGVDLVLMSHINTCKYYKYVLVNVAKVDTNCESVCGVCLWV